MINDTGDLAAHVTLVSVQQIVIDQRHLVDARYIRVLLSELIHEIEVALGNLGISQVLHDFEVAEEIFAAAVDHGDPLLLQLLTVVVGQDEGANGRVHVATCVAHDDAELVSVCLSWAKRSRAHRLGTRRQPLSKLLHSQRFSKIYIIHEH